MFFFSLFFFAVRLTVSQIFTSLWGILHAQPADFILGAILPFRIKSAKQKLYSWTFFWSGWSSNFVQSFPPSVPDHVFWSGSLALSPLGRIKVQVTFEHAAPSWEEKQRRWSSQGLRPVLLPLSTQPYSKDPERVIIWCVILFIKQLLLCHSPPSPRKWAESQQ